MKCLFYGMNSHLEIYDNRYIVTIFFYEKSIYVEK